MEGIWATLGVLGGVILGMGIERWRTLREIRAIHEAYRVRIKGIHAEWEKQIREIMAETLRMVGAFQGWRNGSHFYVGEGKPVSSQHPDWPPNVGDIRDDPRRKM